MKTGFAVVANGPILVFSFVIFQICLGVGAHDKQGQ